MTLATKPVSREAQTPRGRMIVTIAAQGVLIREKGSRTTYGPIPFGALLDMGAKMEVQSRGISVPRPRKVVTR